MGSPGFVYVDNVGEQEILSLHILLLNFRMAIKLDLTFKVQGVRRHINFIIPQYKPHCGTGFFKIFFIFQRLGNRVLQIGLHEKDTLLTIIKF
jgi:hypothetical protein